MWADSFHFILMCRKIKFNIVVSYYIAWEPRGGMEIQERVAHGSRRGGARGARGGKWRWLSNLHLPPPPMTALYLYTYVLVLPHLGTALSLYTHVLVLANLGTVLYLYIYALWLARVTCLSWNDPYLCILVTLFPLTASAHSKVGCQSWNIPLPYTIEAIKLTPCIYNASLYCS